MADKVAKLNVVPRRADIAIEMTNVMEEVHALAKRGDLQGWSLVVKTGNDVECFYYFEDRLSILGALQMAMARIGSER